MKNVNPIQRRTIKLKVAVGSGRLWNNADVYVTHLKSLVLGSLMSEGPVTTANGAWFAQTYRSVIRLIAAGIFLCPGVAAQSGCTPPASLAARLRTAPGAATYATLGTWYFNHSQTGCAVESFGKAVTLQPTSARYNYLLGLSLYKAGDAPKAITPLERSIQLEPRSAEAHAALASALDQTGNRREAELQWRLMLALDPASPTGLNALSRDLLADLNFNAVIELLHPLVVSGRLSPECSVNLSVAYSKSGLLEDASALLFAEARVQPSSQAVIEALASVLVMQDKFQDAVALLSKWVREHPGDSKTQILLLRTMVLARDTGAEPLGKQLMSADPHQWETLYLMGLLRAQSGDYATARTFFERAMTLRPAEAEPHLQLGVALEELKNYSSAEQQLKQAIALGLETPQVHFELAKAMRSQGDNAGAQRELERSRQIQKAQADRAEAAAKVQRAQSAEAAGDLQKAVQAYRDASSLDPAEPVLAYKLAMALDRLGDRQAERAALEQAIHVDPQMAIAQNQLGYLDSSDGNAESAILHFQLAVQADLGYTKGWINLAAALCVVSRWQDARSALAHAMALDPNSESAHRLLQQIDAADPPH